MYHERYGVLFAVKSGSNRKLTVMDLKMGRQITFTLDEIESEEMEDDLKQFIIEQMDKINSGYYDYTETHKTQNKPTSNN